MSGFRSVDVSNQSLLTTPLKTENRRARSRERESQSRSRSRNHPPLLLNDIEGLPSIERISVPGTSTKKAKNRRSWSLPEEESSLATFLAKTRSSFHHDNKRNYLVSSDSVKFQAKESQVYVAKSSSMDELAYSVTNCDRKEDRTLKKYIELRDRNMSTIKSKSAPSLLALKENIGGYREKIDVTDRIRNFISKPNPPRPPSSLKMPKLIGFQKMKKSLADQNNNNNGHARSDVDDLSGFSFNEDPVNTDTCPNSTFHPSRSLWYYGSKKGKCRYLRIPDSPAPPIWSIFELESTNGTVDQ